MLLRVNYETIVYTSGLIPLVTIIHTNRVDQYPLGSFIRDIVTQLQKVILYTHTHTHSTWRRSNIPHTSRARFYSWNVNSMVMCVLCEGDQTLHALF